MKLDNLKKIYTQMISNGLERHVFKYKHNAVIFDVLYFIDESPHVLGFGVLEHNFYFEVEIKKGFQLNPVLNSSDYTQLCKILNLKYDPNNPFKTSIFFDEFNKQLPNITHTYSTPLPQTIAVYRSNVDEPEKIYFLGWLDNNKTSHVVSLDNLLKTKKLLSNKAYERCKKGNISSRWTDKSHLAKNYFEPTT